MTKIYIITVGTDINGYYNILMDSCKRLNLNIVNLALYKKWEGLKMKYTLFKNYLNKLNNNDIVIFVDAYDVFFLENEKEILRKFYKFNRPIVFGLQNGFLTNIFMNKCRNNNLNSGSYMGYVKYLKNLLRIIHNYPSFNKIKSDQLILNSVCQKSNFFKKYVAVDSNQDIFYITNLDTRINFKYLFTKNIGLQLKNGKILKKDNRQPSIIHLAANVNGEEMVKYLNYNTSRIKNIDNSFKVGQCKTFVLNFFNKYYINLISIVIIILIIILIYNSKKIFM